MSRTNEKPLNLSAKSKPKTDLNLRELKCNFRVALIEKI